ncbi:hypothetical protein [Litorihabitans aurantiacus]|nr:hypothetical protein [Litorihabitans aurantiacus]
MKVPPTSTPTRHRVGEVDGDDDAGDAEGVAVAAAELVMGRS